jgi:anti-sigma factor RsiW
MNELEYKQLREIGWRRKLTPEEEIRLQSYLLARPDAQAEWEEDLALNYALDRLPDAPLASNFTAQVMRAIDLETAANERQSRKVRGWQWWVHQFFPKAALGVLTLTLGALGVVQVQKENHRAERARYGAEVFRVAGVLPDVDMWQDFEAIRRYNTNGPAVSDDELLAALK